MHDNDPKHKWKLVSQYLNEKGIEVLDHPPQSPCLNPIENLFDEIDRMVPMKDRYNLETFQAALFSAWEKLDKAYIKNLIDSMPRSLQAVIDNKGHAILY